jgi:hypothetical protein
MVPDSWPSANSSPHTARSLPPGVAHDIFGCQTFRYEKTASVRHVIAFCFEPQDEIIRRQQLFHGAGDNYVAQALKDTLPYFLRAVDDEYIRKREQLLTGGSWWRLVQKTRNHPMKESAGKNYERKTV